VSQRAAGWSDLRLVRRLRAGRGRPLGLALVAVLAGALLAPTLPLRDDLRLAGFDGYQRLWPRRPRSAPVVIVEVDEASLARHGQWPWPRTLVAQVLERIAAGGPAAIGVDVVMPEPDRVSPDRVADLVAGRDPELAARLARLPGHDALLAGAIEAAPVVLGVAGLPAGVARPPAPAAGPARRTPVRVRGPDPAARVLAFPAAVRSLPRLHAAAAGHGLLNPDPDGGTVRRMPAVARVEEALVPGLGVEMLRVAGGAPALEVRADPRGVAAVTMGDLEVATRPDGTVWVAYGPHDAGRFVSAVDLLDGRVPPERFARRLVLVGVTALGLGDYHATPVDPRMPGVEIHAQLLEGIFDGALLARPAWAAWLEAGLLAAGGIALVLAVPAWPVGAVVVLAGAVAAALGLGAGLFLRLGLLVDAAGPVVGLALAYTTMLGAGLAEADSQRRALRRQVQREREAAARLAGELEAARRIQMAALPDAATAFPGEARFTVHASMEPARVVGGDLYDFFLLDPDRLFVLIGDVAGKGLPGSLFMAVSKALCKSAALRRGRDLAATVREADRELSRDNGEAMFVTLFAAVLDARTGDLAYVNAGHEMPYLVERGSVRQLAGGAGPPLCVVEDFAYQAASVRLAPGTMLCLVTDGLTEAERPDGQLYGRQRLLAALAALVAPPSAAAVGEAVRADVARFAAGAEASDDRALLVVEWRGPAAPPVSGP
jgi:CHASE2 domain-containing sensor protein/serine phosphatase RsbU (regulator of sigma subunit)